MANNRKKQHGDRPNGVEQPTASQISAKPNVGLDTPRRQAAPEQSASATALPEDHSDGEKHETKVSGSAAVSLDQLRSRVQSSLSALAKREQDTRDRLKELDVRLQPLLKTVKKVAQGTDLNGQAMMQLRAQAEERSLAVTARLKGFVRETQRSYAMCEEFLVSVARQCRRFEALVGSQASEYQTAVVQATDEIEKQCCSILEWVRRKEEQYFGEAQTGDAPGISSGAAVTDDTAASPDTSAEECQEDGG